MTIASEIQRIQTNIANTYDALEAKGATMPATENSNNLASTVATIPSGGGDIVSATNTTGTAIASGDKVWLEKVTGGWNIILFANISSTSLSGFAESAIADGASGEVKTVLPEEVTVTVTTDVDNADISAE